MPTQIYVNLPVKDLSKSKEFFGSLGFEFNKQFTSNTGACMVVAPNIYVMLLTESWFKTFTPNPVCDAKKNTEVLVCISTESKKRVDEMVANAVKSGGSTFSEPKDHGFMYQHGFQDLDGHVWEVISTES